VMGRSTLRNGEQVDIVFDRSERACIYDLKVVYTDGDSAEWDRINLCNTHRISLFWDRKDGSTRAVIE